MEPGEQGRDVVERRISACSAAARYADWYTPVQEDSAESVAGNYDAKRPPRTGRSPPASARHAAREHAADGDGRPFATADAPPACARGRRRAPLSIGADVRQHSAPAVRCRSITASRYATQGLNQGVRCRPRVV